MREKKKSQPSAFLTRKASSASEMPARRLPASLAKACRIEQAAAQFTHTIHLLFTHKFRGGTKIINSLVQVINCQSQFFSLR
jgi:citrate lyase alpha subunit